MKESFGNRFRYPKLSLGGKILNFLLNNKLFTKLKRILFFPFLWVKLKSDITDVVYLNWMVPADKIQHLIPNRIKFTSYDDHVLFTILTYRHGNLRPAAANKIKTIFGSPNQSNWRFYLSNSDDFGLEKPTILFVKNMMDNLLYTLGSRTVSNILLTHLPAKFIHKTSTLGQITTKIKPGQSNAPDLTVIATPVQDWQLPPAFKSAFDDVETALKIICNQDFAIAEQPDNNRFAISQINLQFEMKNIIPAKISGFKSSFLYPLLDETDCFAFIIPKLKFTAFNESLIKLKS